MTRRGERGSKKEGGCGTRNTEKKAMSAGGFKTGDVNMGLVISSEERAKIDQAEERIRMTEKILAGTQKCRWDLPEVMTRNEMTYFRNSDMFFTNVPEKEAEEASFSLPTSRFPSYFRQPQKPHNSNQALNKTPSSPPQKKQKTSNSSNSISFSGIEIYATEKIVDLSHFALNSGRGTHRAELILSGSANAGQYIYVTDQNKGFSKFFGGLSPKFTTPVNIIEGNGAIELIDPSSRVVHDTFGVVNVDSTGEGWEIKCGWAYKKSGTRGASFNIGEWSYSGINAWNGASDNDSSSSVMPIGTFVPNDDESRKLIITGVFDKSLLTIFISLDEYKSNQLNQIRNLNFELEQQQSESEQFRRESEQQQNKMMQQKKELNKELNQSREQYTQSKKHLNELMKKLEESRGVSNKFEKKLLGSENKLLESKNEIEVLKKELEKELEQKKLEGEEEFDMEERDDDAMMDRHIQPTELIKELRGENNKLKKELEETKKKLEQKELKEEEELEEEDLDDGKNVDRDAEFAASFKHHAGETGKYYLKNDDEMAKWEKLIKVVNEFHPGFKDLLDKFNMIEKLIKNGEIKSIAHLIATIFKATNSAIYSFVFDECGEQKEACKDFLNSLGKNGDLKKDFIAGKLIFQSIFFFLYIYIPHPLPPSTFPELINFQNDEINSVTGDGIKVVVFLFSNPIRDQQVWAKKSGFKKLISWISSNQTALANLLPDLAETRGRQPNEILQSMLNDEHMNRILHIKLLVTILAISTKNDNIKCCLICKTVHNLIREIDFKTLGLPGQGIFPIPHPTNTYRTSIEAKNGLKNFQEIHRLHPTILNFKYILAFFSRLIRNLEFKEGQSQLEPDNQGTIVVNGPLPRMTGLTKNQTGKKDEKKKNVKKLGNEGDKRNDSSSGQRLLYNHVKDTVPIKIISINCGQNGGKCFFIINTKNSQLGSRDLSLRCRCNHCDDDKRHRLFLKKDGDHTEPGSYTLCNGHCVGGIWGSEVIRGRSLEELVGKKMVSGEDESIIDLNNSNCNINKDKKYYAIAKATCGNRTVKGLVVNQVHEFNCPVCSIPFKNLSRHRIKLQKEGDSCTIHGEHHSLELIKTRETSLNEAVISAKEAALGRGVKKGRSGSSQRIIAAETKKKIVVKIKLPSFK